MKRNLLRFINLVCLFVITGKICLAQALPTASIVGHVTAEVIPVFAASESTQLNFGRFSPGVQGGEIILSPLSTVSLLGSIYKGPELHIAASFFVAGDNDGLCSITLPKSPVTLSHISSAKTMQIKDWVSIPTPGTGTVRLQNGFQTVYVGATLKVGPVSDNPVGIYTGTYSISFDFN